MSTKTPTTARTEEAKPALVPKLRFPEFRGAEGWVSKQLSSVGQLMRGLTYSSDDVAPAGLLVLRSTNIQDGSLVLDANLVFVSKPCPEALRLQTGDIVICMSNGSKALVGKSGEYSGEYESEITVGAFCSFFRPKLPFAKIAFHLNSYQKYIANLIAGGNINNLTNSVLEEFSFPVPLLAVEQQKITDCLGSLDELIAAQARKVDALKTHKKGLMQQLFPREGETQPRLRFPEFQNSEDWKRLTLGSVCSRIMDGTHFSPKSKAGPRPYLTSKNIKHGWIDLSNLSWISEDEHAEIYNKCPVKPRDVLLTKDGANTGNCAINNLDFEFSLLSSVAVLRANPDKLCQEFLFQSILSDSTQSLITESMSGQAITRITLAKIGGFTISVTSTTEQQRIADCLTSLDTLITAATQELETLKTHKKGLMQQLFPSSEAVEA